MRVVHISGSSIQTPGNKSWIEQWRQYSGVRIAPVECVARGCHRTAVHGAHVRYRIQWFVVPTCVKHNVGQNGKAMMCKSGTVLMPTNPTWWQRVGSFCSARSRRRITHGLAWSLGVGMVSVGTWFYAWTRDSY